MPTSSLHSDRDLFFQIAEGNEAAFTELFHSYTPKLLPFVIKLTRDEQQANEVIQETFLRIWVGRMELPKVEQPSSWIFRIASNVSVSYLRSLGRKRKMMETVGKEKAEIEVRAEDEMDAKELDGFIRQAVAALPEKRQQIYRLSREKGLSHQQIADELGLSINTVKDQIGKALKTIQEHIHLSTGLSLITVVLLIGL
ncbi:MAG TPA: RNA polymerase sigma-70 factor [Chitinophagaceae bacterium]|nr:RNA polymerase sigma-70 factor [Chitinophagaceae bacterium]